MKPAIYYAPHATQVQGNAAYKLSPIASIPYCLPGFCWGGGEWIWEDDIIKQLNLVHGYNLTTVPDWFPLRNKEGAKYERWCYAFDRDRGIGEWVGEMAAKYNPAAAARLAHFYATYDEGTSQSTESYNMGAGGKKKHEG